MAAIETFVPRREIKSENKVIRSYAERMAKGTRDHCDFNREAVISRVGEVEKSLDELHATAKSANRLLLGTVGSGLVAFLGCLATNMLHIKVFWPT